MGGEEEGRRREYGARRREERRGRIEKRREGRRRRRTEKYGMVPDTLVWGPPHSGTLEDQIRSVDMSSGRR